MHTRRVLPKPPLYDTTSSFVAFSNNTFALEQMAVVTASLIIQRTVDITHIRPDINQNKRKTTKQNGANNLKQRTGTINK